MLYAAIVVVALPVMLAVLAGISRSGEAPGLLGGKLRPCGAAPNAVCSEDSKAARQVEPINGATENDWQLLCTAVSRLGGTIHDDTGDYLWATFRSRVFGFVDDFEARRDVETNVIHLRSASRVGHSDLGANSRRVEQIRNSLKQ
jgi:uncharacterized protein (DUF1499 family)